MAKGRARSRPLLFPLPSFSFPLVILSASLPPSVPRSRSRLSSPRSFLSKAGACNYPLARVTTATDCDVLRPRPSKPARRHVPDAGYARARLAGRVTWYAPPLPTFERTGASAPTGRTVRHRDVTRRNARERASERATSRSFLGSFGGYGCVHSRPRLYTPCNPLRSCIRSSLREVSLWKRHRSASLHAGRSRALLHRFPGAANPGPVGLKLGKTQPCFWLDAGEYESLKIVRLEGVYRR